jgi:hypothetical protein
MQDRELRRKSPDDLGEGPNRTRVVMRAYRNEAILAEQGKDFRGLYCSSVMVQRHGVEGYVWGEAGKCRDLLRAAADSGRALMMSHFGLWLRGVFWIEVGRTLDCLA